MPRPHSAPRDVLGSGHGARKEVSTFYGMRTNRMSKHAPMSVTKKTQPKPQRRHMRMEGDEIIQNHLERTRQTPGGTQTVLDLFPDHSEGHKRPGRMPTMHRTKSEELARKPVSPFLELGAYELLWSEEGASFKTISKKFEGQPGALPSDFVARTKARECADIMRRRMIEASVDRFGVCVHGTTEYPSRLRHAAYPVELLYFRGQWDLVFSKCIAIVGTRKPSREGIARTRRLVRELVKDDYTIVSGLAEGIDTAAHEAALETGGRTIAVIGTPLSHVYPKKNKQLQDKIADQFLVVSQVPLCRYERQDFRLNRFQRPEPDPPILSVPDLSKSYGNPPL